MWRVITETKSCIFWSEPRWRASWFPPFLYKLNCCLCHMRSLAITIKRNTLYFILHHGNMITIYSRYYMVHLPAYWPIWTSQLDMDLSPLASCWRCISAFACTKGSGNKPSIQKWFKSSIVYPKTNLCRFVPRVSTDQWQLQNLRLIPVLSCTLKQRGSPPKSSKHTKRRSHWSCTQAGSVPSCNECGPC